LVWSSGVFSLACATTFIVYHLFRWMMLFVVVASDYLAGWSLQWYRSKRVDDKILLPKISRLEERVVALRGERLSGVEVVNEMAMAGSEPVPVEKPLKGVAALLTYNKFTKQWLLIGGVTAVFVQRKEKKQVKLVTAKHVFEYYGMTQDYYVGAWTGSEWVLESLKGSRIYWASLQGDVLFLSPPKSLCGRLGLQALEMAKPRLHSLTHLCTFYQDVGWTTVSGGLARHPIIINGLSFTGSTASGSSGNAYIQSRNGALVVVGVHRGADRKLDVNIGHSLGWFVQRDGPAPPRILPEWSSEEDSIRDDTEADMYDEDDERRTLYILGSDDEDAYVRSRQEAFERANREGLDLFYYRGGGGEDDEQGLTVVGHPTASFRPAQKEGDSGQPNSPPLSVELIPLKLQQCGEGSVGLCKRIEFFSKTTDLDSNKSDTLLPSGPSALLRKQAEQLQELERLSIVRQSILEEQEKILLEAQQLRDTEREAARTYSEELARQKIIRMREAEESKAAKTKAALELQKVKDQLAKVIAEKAAMTGKSAAKSRKKTTKQAAPAESVIVSQLPADAASIARELFKLSNPSGKSLEPAATPPRPGEEKTN